MTLDKSPDAFRTISEVAEDLKLPQHVLRFWETRFPQIKPLKRGGGRRYYRPDDVQLLRAIRHLLYGEGYTIKGVQRILKDQGARAVAALPYGDDTFASGGDLPLFGGHVFDAVESGPPEGRTLSQGDGQAPSPPCDGPAGTELLDPVRAERASAAAGKILSPDEIHDLRAA